MTGTKTTIRAMLWPKRVRDVLYRLPWSVGLVCCSFLLIGWRLAQACSFRAERLWTSGAYRASWVAASVLVYATAASVVALVVGGWKRRDIGGLALVVVFAFALMVFGGVFMHKTLGFVIWPMGR